MSSLAHSQNKRLSEYQRRASQLHTGTPSHCPQRQRGRCVTARAGRQGAAVISAPETGILHQTVNRLPVANHIFPGCWMADICQEGHNLRSAPQSRHTAHLRWCSRGPPGKLSGLDRGWGVIKMLSPSGTVCSQSYGHLSCSHLGNAQNTGPTKSVPLWST